MRPLGEIAQALVRAAATPGTVRAVCERAQVGYDAGRYTASRLMQRGWLEEVPDGPVGDAVRSGPGRPATVVVATKPRETGVDVRQVMQRSFWERPLEHELAAGCPGP